MRRGLLCAALVALAAPLAHAGNETHPRTPVAWPENAPCVTVIDKLTTPRWHLEYGIPYEDTDVTPDEVDDSRTHQFIAICRDHGPAEFLPTWMSQADVDAAAAKGLADPEVIQPERIFDLAPAWAGCFERINADDERRPITFEAARQGVDWDVASVAPGTYILYGFTHEPSFNRWTHRPGIVKVIEGGLPSDIGPGAAITSRELRLYREQSGTIEGCVDAAPGSTLTMLYASNTGSEDPAWQPDWIPFAEDEAVDGETFALDIDPPDSEEGNSLFIRADVLDPAGRTYTAYMRETVVALRGTDEVCEQTGGGFISMPCDPGETSTGSGSTSTGSTATSAGLDDDDGGGGGGCGCRGGGGPRSTWWELGLLLGLATVRRTESAVAQPADRTGRAG